MTARVTIPAFSSRYASVDALRGLTVAAMLLVNNPGDWSHVYAPLLHAPWHGLTPTDLIFPLFLFIVGVSIALAVSPRIERGESKPRLAKAVLVRAARIVALGLLLHACAMWAFDLPHYRPMGVLQRIGLCYAVAGLLAICTRPPVRWVFIALLVLGYAAALVSGGSLEPFENIASRIDFSMLGEHVYQLDPATGRGHDPEGLTSTLGALATTLIGLEAGRWLREGRVWRLWIGAVVMLIAGQLWSLALPLNKNLWTPSYVLWTAGTATVLMALAHWLVDQRGLPAWGRTFGVNAIAAYAGSALLLYALAAVGWLEPIYQRGFAGWMTPTLGPYVPSLAYALVFVALWWGIVRWLDARRIYFKI
jgi:predicted acyltransferase